MHFTVLFISPVSSICLAILFLSRDYTVSFTLSIFFLALCSIFKKNAPSSGILYLLFQLPFTSLFSMTIMINEHLYMHDSFLEIKQYYNEHLYMHDSFLEIKQYYSMSMTRWGSDSWPDGRKHTRIIVQRDIYKLQLINLIEKMTKFGSVDEFNVKWD